MTRARPFMQVDVFTATPLLGNPVAVVLDGTGLDDRAMQAFANWTNLSETTFVLPPSDPAADYAVRIFTPRSELPFAGHPTLGTAHAVISSGIAAPRSGRLVQQSAIGLVEVAVADDGLSFRLPPATLAPAPDGEGLARALGATPISLPMIVDVGPRWVIAEMANAVALKALTPDFAALAEYDRAHGTTGQTLFGQTGDADGTIVVRSFAAADGIAEDPVCGSGNGSVAAYRRAMGQVGPGSHYLARQGMNVGRNGAVSITFDGNDIHVGGQCCTVITGTAHI